jgi:hypothetical protein
MKFLPSNRLSKLIFLRDIVTARDKKKQYNVSCHDVTLTPYMGKSVT